MLVGGEVPIQSWWGGGFPTQSVMVEGVPHPVMVEMYPIQSWWGGTLGTPSRPGLGEGTPHHQDLAGVTPPPHYQVLAGVHPTIQTWLGYPPPPSRPGWGTPPPSRCGLTNKLKTVPSPILQMRAVKTGNIVES